jgi:small subunit ribosomal protein S3
VVSSAGRKQVDAEAPVAEPLLKEADPEIERLLAEEEEIERRTRESHETPHFRPGED